MIVNQLQKLCSIGMKTDRERLGLGICLCGDYCFIVCMQQIIVVGAGTLILQCTVISFRLCYNVCVRAYVHACVCVLYLIDPFTD